MRRRIDRSGWPAPGPHHDLLKHYDEIHVRNGLKTREEIGAAMKIAKSRVSVLLTGRSVPVSDKQAVDLATALGGGLDDRKKAARLWGLLDRARAAAAPQRSRSRRTSTGSRDRDRTADGWIDAALTGHWLPSVHSARRPHDLQYPLTGRLSVIEHLVDWLVDLSDRRARVVTGDPGSGKSAVLAWMVLSADPHWSSRFLREPDTPDLPSGVRLIAVHARDRTLAEVVSIIARQGSSRATDAEGLVHDLTTGSVQAAVLIDAVDEARDVNALVSELIRPLARAASHGPVRLLVGARRHVTRRIGARWIEELDLDREYADKDALRRYVKRILTDDRSPTSYQAMPARAARVAEKVAHRAEGSFLIGRLVALALVLRPEPAEVMERFPDSVVGAMEGLLDALPDRRRVEDLLRPLAFAEGLGLPQPLWALLAGSLAGLPGKYSLADIDAVFDGPVSSMITSSYPEARDGRVRTVQLYRLFHEALDECLSAMPAPNLDAPQDAAQSQEVIARSLLGARDSGKRTTWLDVDPYVRRHLATHAAESSIMNELLEDPRYLLAADRERLLAAMSQGVGTAAASTARTAYELASHHLGDSTDSSQRASYLALSGLQAGTSALAAGLAEAGVQATWWPLAARWDPSAPHRVLLRHDGPVNAVAVAQLDHDLIAVSGGEDGVVRACNIAAVSERMSYDADLGDPVRALDVVELDGLPVVAAGTDDGRMHVLNLPNLEVLARSDDKHPTTITAVCGVMVGKDWHVLVGGLNGQLTRWSLLPLQRSAGPVAVGEGEVGSLAVLSSVTGAPEVVCCMGSGTLQVSLWSLGSQRTVYAQRPRATAVLAVQDPDGPTLVTAHMDGSIRVLDPRSGKVVHELSPIQDSYLAALAMSGSSLICAGDDGSLTVLDPFPDDPVVVSLQGHHDAVFALVPLVIGDRPIVLSGSEDGTVRQWSLTQRSLDAARHPATSWAATHLFHVNGRVAAASFTDESTEFRTVVDGMYLRPPQPVDPEVPTTAAAVFTIDGRCFAVTGHSDGTITMWPVTDTGPEVRIPGHDDWVAGITIGVLAGQPVLVTVGHDRTLRCWNPTTCSEARAPLHLSGLRAFVQAICVVADSEDLVAVLGTKAGEIQMLRLSDGHVVGFAELDDADSTVEVWTSTEGTITGGTSDGRLITCTTDPEDSVRTVRQIGHNERVTALATGVLNDMEVYISGTESGTVTVSLPAGQEVTSFTVDAMVNDLLLEPDGGGGLTVATNRGIVTVAIRTAETRLGS